MRDALFRVVLRGHVTWFAMLASRGGSIRSYGSPGARRFEGRARTEDSRGHIFLDFFFAVFLVAFFVAFFFVVFFAMGIDPFNTPSELYSNVTC